MPVSDLDIRRVARLLIKRHGGPYVAAQRADECLVPGTATDKMPGDRP